MIKKVFTNIYIKIFKRKQWKESLKIMDTLLDVEKIPFCSNKNCFHNKNGNCEHCDVGFYPNKRSIRNTNKLYRTMRY